MCIFDFTAQEALRVALRLNPHSPISAPTVHTCIWRRAFISTTGPSSVGTNRAVIIKLYGDWVYSLGSVHRVLAFYLVPVGKPRRRLLKDTQ